MEALDLGVLLRARTYLSIIKHEEGKIRLRYRLGALTAIPELRSKTGRKAVMDIDGILDVDIWPLTFTLIIRYDAAKIRPAWWSDLLVGPEEKARWVVDQLRDRGLRAAGAEAT